MDWEEVKEKFPRGTIVEGVVTHHAPFGFFVEISKVPFRGLVELPDIRGDHEKLKPGEIYNDFPVIGSVVRVVVLGFRESKTDPQFRQLGLSMKPSLIKKAELGLDPLAPH